MDKYTVNLNTLKKALKTFTPKSSIATWSYNGILFLGKSDYCDYMIELHPTKQDNSYTLRLEKGIPQNVEIKMENAIQKLVSMCNIIDLEAQAKS